MESVCRRAWSCVVITSCLMACQDTVEPASEWGLSEEVVSVDGEPDAPQPPPSDAEVGEPPMENSDPGEPTRPEEPTEPVAPVEPVEPLPGFARIIAPDCALTRGHLVSCWRTVDRELVERVLINEEPRDWLSIEVDRDRGIVCGVDTSERFECFAVGEYASSVAIVNTWLEARDVSDFVLAGRTLQLIVDGHIVSAVFPGVGESSVGVDLDALGEAAPRYVRFSETSRENSSNPLVRTQFALDDAGAVSSDVFEVEPIEGLEFVSLAHGRFDGYCGVTRDARGVCVRPFGGVYELELPDGDGVRQIVPASGLNTSHFQMYVVSTTGRVFEASMQDGVYVHEEPVVDPVQNVDDRSLMQVYAGDPSCGLVEGGHDIACFGAVGDPAWLEDGATDVVAAPARVVEAPALWMITSSASGDRHCGVSQGGGAYCWGRGQTSATELEDFDDADELFIGPAEVVCGLWRQEREIACEVRAFVTPEPRVFDQDIISAAVHRDALIVLLEDGVPIELGFNGASYNVATLRPPEPFEVMTATTSLVCGVGRSSGALYCGQERASVWTWRQLDVGADARAITFVASYSSSALVAPAPPSTLCAGYGDQGVYCATVGVGALARDDFDGVNFRALDVPRTRQYVGGVVSARSSCAYDAASVLSCADGVELDRFEDRFSQVSLGVDTRCGLDEAGFAWCWGSDARSGALGRGLPLEVNTPRVALGWDDLFGE